MPIASLFETSSFRSSDSFTESCCYRLETLALGFSLWEIGAAYHTLETIVHQQYQTTGVFVDRPLALECQSQDASHCPGSRRFKESSP